MNGSVEEWWEDLSVKQPKKFEIICKKCKGKCSIVNQRYLDQGYLPTERRTIIRCPHCGQVE